MDLDALVATQHGVLTTRQAVAAGVSVDAVRHRIETNRWQRMLPGVVVTTTGQPTDMARRWAAILYAGPGAALSHASGLAVWRFDVPADALVHITVPHARKIRGTGFVQAHRSRHCAELDVLIRQDLPVLRFERCLLDTAAAATSRDAVRDLLAAAAQRGRTTLARLYAALDAAGGPAGAGQVRRVLAAVAAGEHSALEQELADLLVRFGLPEPRRQWPVQTESGRRVLDFAYDEVFLALEAEGAEWHLSPAAWADDLARQNALVASGWTLLRFTARDIRHHPDRVAALVAAELTRRGVTWRSA